MEGSITQLSILVLKRMINNHSLFISNELTWSDALILLKVHFELMSLTCSTATRVHFLKTLPREPTSILHIVLFVCLFLWSLCFLSVFVYDFWLPAQNFAFSFWYIRWSRKKTYYVHHIFNSCPTCSKWMLRFC